MMNLIGARLTSRVIARCKMRLRRLTMLIRIIVFLFFVTFGVLLPITCWNLPFSRYYIRRRSTHTLEMAIKKDTLEGQEAYQYFSDMNAQESVDFYKQAFVQKKLKYAIGIITVSRQSVTKDSEIYSPQYLPRVVAKFDRLLKKYNRKDVVFFLCNAQTNPEEHESALKLSKYVPSVQKKHNATLNVHRAPNAREREKQDYVFCINHIRKFNATYSILVQDDALPYPQFIKDLDRIIETRIENKIIRGRLTRNVDKLASVKFYFPEKWLGYGTDSSLIFELVAIGVLGGGILYAILSRFTKTPTSFKRIVLYAVCSFYVGLLMFAIGRPYLLPLRMLSPDYYSIVGAPECCIPAVLYKTEYLEHLERHLTSITCYVTYPLDVAISRFYQRVSLDQYLVLPNLIDHIGVYSSLHKAPKDPHSFMT